MSTVEQEGIEIENNGPPAKNLRKKSGSSSVQDLNMATMSDKLEKATTASTRKTLKETKEKERERKLKSNPSVKSWLNNKDDPDSASITSSIDNFDPQGRNTVEQGEVLVTNTQAVVEEWNNDEIPENLKELDFDSMDEATMRDLLKAMFKEVRVISKFIQGQKITNAECVRKVREINQSLTTVTKTVIKHDRSIDTTQEKVNLMELKQMRNNLIISGLPETKGEKAKEVAANFFKEKMKITKDIEIKAAFRQGGKDRENRALIVVLSDATSKGIIYKSAKNLKDTEFYVSDQLPSKQAEEQRQAKNKVKINKALIDAQQQDLEWKKGQLFVDGNQYKPKVHEPSCADVLEMDKAYIRSILAYSIQQSQTITKNGSDFIGFAARVYSIKDVITAYRQLKYRFMDATHVICSFRIMDQDVAHMQDCVD